MLMWWHILPWKRTGCAYRLPCCRAVCCRSMRSPKATGCTAPPQGADVPATNDVGAPTVHSQHQDVQQLQDAWMCLERTCCAWCLHQPRQCAVRPWPNQLLLLHCAHSSTHPAEKRGTSRAPCSSAERRLEEGEGAASASAAAALPKAAGFCAA